MARRRHVFWECPVAQHVVDQLRAGMPSREAAASLSRADVWLLRVPAPAKGVLREDIWGLVCVLAIHAMERGRSSLWVMQVKNASAASPTTPTSQRAGNRAAAWLWHLLGEFASIGQVPSAWRGSDISPTHPFLGHQRAAPVVNGEGEGPVNGPSPRWAVNLPRSWQIGRTVAT